MTAIVRVKRHRGEDPVEALVLSCKRKKTEESDDSNLDSIEKILNFSGTVEEKDDKIAKNTVQSFTKESKFSKTHVPDIKAKLRKEQKERSDGSRFTLLSCLRSNNASEDSEGGANSELGENVTIVDVSKKVEHNAEEDYVYDLYSTQLESDSDFHDLIMGSSLSIYDCELTFRNGEDCYDDDVDPDEDDSNDENNWRNDYPDTDSEMEQDDDADILAKQLKRCDLDSDDQSLSEGYHYSLSEDDGEEKYLNYEDDDIDYFYEANPSIGRRYEKYMAKARKGLMDDDGDDNNSGVSSNSDLLSFHENSD